MKIPLGNSINLILFYSILFYSILFYPKKILRKSPQPKPKTTSNGTLRI